MSDEDLKKIADVIRQENKPLHGELAKLKKDFSDLRFSGLRTRSELERISGDTARIDSSADEIREGIGKLEKGFQKLRDDFQEMKDWMGEEFGKVNIKIDGLENSKQLRKEINDIKTHLGLPVNADPT